MQNKCEHFGGAHTCLLERKMYLLSSTRDIEKRKAGRTFERESDIMSCFEFVRKHPEISEGHVYDKETDSKKCMDNSILQNT